MPGASSARAERGDERDPLAVGERGDAGLGAVADAALGHVEDAAQVDRVGGVGQHPQVGQRVLDLLALVEPGAADDLVRQPHPDEDLLERPRLGVGAVEHRDVAGTHAVVVGERSIPAGDERGLVVLVVGDVADDRLAVAAVGPQPLLPAALVAGDDGVGRPQDGLGGAVVLLEQDGARVAGSPARTPRCCGSWRRGRRRWTGRRRRPRRARSGGTACSRGPGRRRCRRARGPAGTGRGWCPGTRRPGRGGTGDGSARRRRGTPGAGAPWS